jgi:hypothetical protein
VTQNPAGACSSTLESVPKSTVVSDHLIPRLSSLDLSRCSVFLA